MQFLKRLGVLLNVAIYRKRTPGVSSAHPRGSEGHAEAVERGFSRIERFSRYLFGVVACPCPTPKVLSSRIIALPLNLLLLC